MGFLIGLALRGRVVTIVVTLLVMIGGVISLTSLRVELFPDVDFPIVTIVAAYPEAPPETVLEEVTIPIETAVDGVEGRDRVRSITSQALSLVIVEFEFGTDMVKAADSITAQVAATTFPQGLRPPTVARLSPDESPIFQMAVLLPADFAEPHELVSTRVLPELQSVPGVFSAEIPVGAAAGVGITRTNGKPSVPVMVVKEPEANTVEVVDGLTEKLTLLASSLPPEVEFVTILNQAPQIKSSIETLEREAVLGALFAVGVIFVFLLSVRPTLVASISIPASILGALVLMGWQGMTLNMMTLGGLAIAVGRVVDDSIVVLENIYRHIQQGGDRVQATLAATREVAGAITTSTLTTIAVFLPLVFIGGIIGTFFFPFALTISFALVASLLVALTVVPALGSILIKPGQATVERDTWTQQAYAPVIRWALDHKLATVVLALVLFVGSFSLLRFVPRTFLPSAGEELLSIELTMPPGTPMGAMLDGIIEVESVLDRLWEQGTVDAFQATVGLGGLFGPGGGSGSLNMANFFIRLDEDADGAETADLLKLEFAASARSISVSQSHGGGPDTNAMELILTGDDYQEVAATAAKLVVALQRLDGLENVGSSALEGGSDAEAPDAVTNINRIDGKRAVIITGSITDTNTQRVDGAVNARVEEVGLPAGVALESGGVFESIREAFSQMARALLFGIILVFAVMVVSMRSLRAPFVIVLSLPLASIGAIGALFITQRALGLPALIGLLMLVGLVVTNAIVLIAFVEQLRARGMSVRDALVEGGRTRLRPILMTAFTTSFALLPLAVIVAEGGIISAELATVVIGGLMTSTFLTLVVIPIAYDMIHRDKAPREAADTPGGEPAA